MAVTARVRSYEFIVLVHHISGTQRYQRALTVLELHIDAARSAHHCLPLGKGPAAVHRDMKDKLVRPVASDRYPSTTRAWPGYLFLTR